MPANDFAARTRRGRRRTTAPLVIAAACLVGAGCARDAQEPSSRSARAPGRPSLLLVVVDTLRADDAIQQHHLRALAASGAWFKRAYSHTATTGPSDATLFTSRYPTAHGVQKNGLVLADEFVSLAEVLRDSGYQTAAFTSSLPVTRGWGLLQGFDLIDDAVSKTEGDRGCRRNPMERCGEQTLAAARAWIGTRRDPTRPYFLFVHLYDPHDPYSPPKEFARPLARGALPRVCAENHPAYRGEVKYTDELIGRFLADARAAGALENTLVVFTADHGEAFGEHQNCLHTGNLYEELVHVPLLFSWPGQIPAGIVVDRPVGLIDVAPTVLGLLGVPARSLSPTGTNLEDLVRTGRADEPPQPIYFERRRFWRPTRVHGRQWHGVQRGVRTGRWKYTRSPLEGTAQLFDLEADPGETKNLIEERPDVSEKMETLLIRWEEEVAERRPESIDPAGMRGDRTERLRKLGYLP